VHKTRTNSLLLTAARSMKSEYEGRQIPTATLHPTLPNQGAFGQMYLKAVDVPCFHPVYIHVIYTYIYKAFKNNVDSS